MKKTYIVTFNLSAIPAIHIGNVYIHRNRFEYQSIPEKESARDQPRYKAERAGIIDLTKDPNICTAGTAGINACGDVSLETSPKQEAPRLAEGWFTFV